MHSIEGDLTYQAYSQHGEFNNSISRLELNKLLLTKAEQAGVAVKFGWELESLDMTAPTRPAAVFTATPTDNGTGNKVGSTLNLDARFVIGSDGGGSRVRNALSAAGAVKFSEEMLSHGYKEMPFPSKSGPGKAGEYTMDSDSLHIWPRGEHMLMALANTDGSFTGTIYLANEGGASSFAQLDTKERVLAFFKDQYPDAIPVLGGEDVVVSTFMGNPVGILGTVRADKYHFGSPQGGSSVLIIGDAAHAIVPFFGQGCNCGFEDVRILAELIDGAGGKMTEAVCSEFTTARKTNADAIADLALDNFDEMQRRTGLDSFILHKGVEGVLEEKLEEKFRSRYQMVTYTTIPYRTCLEAGDVIQEIIETLSEGLTDPANVDLKQAEALLDTKLMPFLRSKGVESLNF
jgi:kynurenine 3-monooxygenase